MEAPDRIERNVADVKKRISTAAEEAGRDPREIVIVAVSKTFPAEVVRAASRCGITDIGESRLQEAEPKIRELGKIVRWHMIGHLQTNKVKKALEYFDMIQSVDSMKLAEEIERRADKMVDCLIELNSSGEESKYGFDFDGLKDAAVRINKMENVSLAGLMTIGPNVDDDEVISRTFRKTRELFLECREVLGESFRVLSMGMSADFELAVREGSNMVRVGTAIFGARD